MPKVLRRRNIDREARRYVSIALDKGYTHEEIASICDVSVGSVKRWMATGRADAQALKHLKEEIGPLYIKPKEVGEILIEIYKTRKRRYRIQKSQLKKISGRSTLRTSFMNELYEYMEENNHIMLEFEIDNECFYVVIRKSQILHHCKETLKLNEINNYYKEIADQFPSDEIDE